jgi:two-component system chemotaxis response regulator CheB
LPLHSDKIIFVGASTGGTEAIKEFLRALPPETPGILIVQHMPETFTRSFASRLDTLCSISVEEARHGSPILPGHAYIAPGHSHLLLDKAGTTYVTALNKSPPFNRHRPSVDLLFQSAAQMAGKHAIGVILTGMGRDGATGMLEMKKAGAYNFAQDEHTSIVFGMPKEAIALGAVDEIVPIQKMAQRVLLQCTNHAQAWP